MDRLQESNKVARSGRREFIRTLGGAAFAAAAWPLDGLRFEQVASPKKLRVAIFFDSSFPLVDGIIAPDKQQLQETLSGFDVTFLGMEELKSRLSTTTFDLLLNPYASAFPRECFDSITKFLSQGGNWVNLGGIPLGTPVDYVQAGWKIGVSTTTYHKKFGITQTFPVDVRGLKASARGDETSFSQLDASDLVCHEVYELYVRFTSSKDFPAEDGSAGPRDAVIRPIVVVDDTVKGRIAAPIVEIVRLQGSCAGGRWVLANFNGSIGTALIRKLVERAALGALDIVVRPSFASYVPGERPTFVVQFRRPHREATHLEEMECRLQLLADSGKVITSINLKLSGRTPLLYGQVLLAQEVAHRLRPGRYAVSAAVEVHDPATGSATKAVHTTGFWIFDEKLMAGGKAFTVGDQFLLRDGEPYPVTGTTFMSSDVHRKFLFEPNPYEWDVEFARMKSAGVNMIRTGIWTAWKNAMLDAGAPNETVFRAMDAFLLTARKHDIPVIFTFFAFLPETWGGVNPYLDPRAVNAQKEFVAAFTHRYRTSDDLIWDLINEPSFCNPQFLWQCRPNGDVFEASAWKEWLRRQFPAPTAEEHVALLQDVFRATADEAQSLPSPKDFEDANIFSNQYPVKAIAYRLFAQEQFEEWVDALTEAIRSNGNTKQLITVGQDEGGTYERPSNQFFGNSVSFTCLHNWWLNDDLLWDQVVTKTPGKPNLVEETGNMFYESMEGKPWRTEQSVSDLLERKMALAVGGGTAGFIQWIWNTNPYMTLDNESAIGFHRADGTVKPELSPFSRISSFVRQNKNLFTEYVAPDVLMVIPHSSMFSTRNAATEATQRCVRTMGYSLGVPMLAISEYRIDQYVRVPPLIIMPSPRTIGEQCWQGLMRLVEQGSTLLVSGVIDSDDRWLPAARTKSLGLECAIAPVAAEEFLQLQESQIRLSYRGNKLQRVQKAVVQGTDPKTHTVAHGKGRIIWSPLPVELSDAVEPLVNVYEYALMVSGVKREITMEGSDASILFLAAMYREAILCTLISETSQDKAIVLHHHRSSARLEVMAPAGRSAMLFVDRQSGKIISHLA